MKKILLLLAFIFALLTSKAEITNFQTYIEGTEVEFYWQGDTTLSKVYEVGILEPEDFNYITYVAAYSSAFVAGTGWFGFSTDLALKYGYNWSDYEGTAAAEYFPKDAWDASVDSLESGLTLKPGIYVVYAEGYDNNYKNVTEELAYDIVEIEAPVTTDAVEVIETEKKAVKFLNPKGQLMIYSNGSFYDQLGRKVQ